MSDGGSECLDEICHVHVRLGNVEPHRPDISIWAGLGDDGAQAVVLAPCAARPAKAFCRNVARHGPASRAPACRHGERGRRRHTNRNGGRRCLIPHAQQYPALFSVSPYGTRWMLYKRFADGLDMDTSPNSRMSWGLKMQPLILAQAAEAEAA